METEKVYCKGCCHRWTFVHNGRWGEFCKIKSDVVSTHLQPSVQEYTTWEPSVKNKNNDCKDFTPSRLHRLWMWITRKVSS